MVLNLNTLTKVEFRVGRVTSDVAKLTGATENATFIVMRVEDDPENNMMFYGDDPTGDDLTDYTILFKYVIESIVAKAMGQSIVRNCPDGQCNLAVN